MTQPDFHEFRRGDAVPVFHFSVSAEEARAYLDATGDAHATLWTETVPPLAAGALLLAGCRSTPGINVAQSSPTPTSTP